jgi:predicted kinase
MSRPELLITRGLPGCGKSYFARAWVATDPQTRARINRDDARIMLHGGYQSRPTEQQITLATHAAIHALLHSGTSVICDDTNLIDEHVQPLEVLAERAGAAVRIVDMRDTPLDLCLSRNATRAGTARLDDQVIRSMFAEHIKPRLADIPR